jgi:DNA-binding Lrp family transcriptional regulator
MNMLTDLEKKIIALLQTDIPVVKRPFLAMAEKIGITEKQFLKVLNDLNDQGMIRRFGATIKHQKSGFKANAMVAWKVAEEQVERVGAIMATFGEITHCYRRDPAPGWEYNLYTMVHAADEAGCHAIVEKISQAVGEKKYTLLFSRQELKKTSMKYFED